LADQAIDLPCPASAVALRCRPRYGNALKRSCATVEELETAGVAALSIEDTDLPVPFGGAKRD